MSDDAEPRFSGMPATPAPEVFEQARSNNPEWYRLVERAYEQFAAQPENVGVYADPKGAERRSSRSGSSSRSSASNLTAFSYAHCPPPRPSAFRGS